MATLLDVDQWRKYANMYGYIWGTMAYDSSAKSTKNQGSEYFLGLSVESVHPSLASLDSTCEVH